MVIGRTQDDAAETALRHKSVFALGRFGRGPFGLIKRGKVFLQDMPDRFVLG